MANNSLNYASRNPVDGQSLGTMSGQGQIQSDSQISNPQIVTESFYKAAQQKIISTISNKAPTVSRRGQNLYGVDRSPWVFATFDAVQGAESPDNTIVWAANPKSVSWQINQRASESKNKSGTVLHVWRDRLRNTDYDDPKITFQFQAGNILPTANDVFSPDLAPKNNPPVDLSDGLRNFYQFLSLVDAPKIASTGEANLIHVLYRSRIFPNMILTGFFDPQVVVQFQDDGQNPNTISGWQATFTVYSTTPKLNNFSELIARFKEDGLAGI